MGATGIILRRAERHGTAHHHHHGGHHCDDPHCEDHGHVHESEPEPEIGESPLMRGIRSAID
jgi:hypothetical protein